MALDNVRDDVQDWIIENHPYPLILTAGEAHESADRNEILYVNRAFEEMSGYPSREIVGEKPSALQGPKTDPHLKEFMAEKLEAGKHHVAETVNYRKNGEEYAVRMSIEPITQDGEVTHWISIQKDVTNNQLRRGFETE